MPLNNLKNELWKNLNQAKLVAEILYKTWEVFERLQKSLGRPERLGVDLGKTWKTFESLRKTLSLEVERNR